jgi:ATP-dependent Clp protease ATP-binding subunit ClpA
LNKKSENWLLFLADCTHLYLFATMLYPCHHLTTSVCSDRFLPDKAIDLIDEAGSRVRLQHAQVKIQVIAFKHLVA